ncbi:helix-turn-helix transcriptional regulator [Parolsenella sp. LCP21S3_E11]|uniref:helix-turn-helix transcriptional regulator n=1 Tax=Parolsenella sp. LCP21S3_E11 TaxID=3438797 RepID=UPI003F9CEEE0
MFKLSLKIWRKKAGYKTQSEAAKALGMKERRYASLEREEVALTLEDAYEISVVFGCTPNDLCDWYATHQRERPRQARLDPEREALLANYDRCTPERRERILMDAREKALLSQEYSERAADAAQGA